MAGFRPAGMALAVAAAFLGMGHALGQPTGAQVIAGQAQLKQQGNSLVVTTQNAAGTSRSVINWQSFSVPAGSTTRFDQPTAQSLSINGVVGNDPSAIYGTLSSNGRLVLVNPAGIAVGAGAVVDTAGFTASTLKMSDADALAGRLTFGDGFAGAGALKVDGNVVARSGDVVLIAPHVQVGSQAVMQAPNGAAILAAGQKVELTGRGLEGIVMQVQAPENSAVNLGTLQGNAVGIFAGTLKHSGLVQANAVTTEGGKVVLKAQGDALVDGAITATAGDKGGSVDVLGNRVGLMAGAVIDASGAAGGGYVRIGGDFHGANPDVPNAQRTYVDPTATIHADATGSGDGGKVAVWADDQTQGYGTITARGGPQGGDGGFVEGSGKNRLVFGAQVDTRAPLGKTGTLLLDPADIDIGASGTAYPSSGIAFGDLPGSSITLDAATVSAAATNVDLQATNSITVSAPVSMTTTNVGLSATAGGTIAVNAPITTKGGAVSLSAGDASAGTLAPSSGALYVQANIDTTGGGAAPGGANVTLKSGLADVGGNSVYISNAVVNGGTAGAVQVQGLWADVFTAGISGRSIALSATSGGVSLNNSSLNAGAGGISLSTIAPGFAMALSSSTLATTGGGQIYLESDSGQTTLSGSTLQSDSGAIYVNAGRGSPAPSGDAINIGNSTLDAGTGLIQISGATADPLAWGVSLGGGVSFSAAPGTQIFGSDSSASLSFSGGGVYVNGALSYSGPLSFAGSTTTGSDAITVANSTIAGVGGLAFNTTTTTTSGGGGLNISTSTLTIGGGALTVDSANTVNIGSSAIDTGGGNAGLGAGTSSMYLSGLKLATGGGAAHLSAAYVTLQGSTLATAGGSASLAGAGSGVYLNADAIDTGGGALTISGTSLESPGVSINGSSLQAGAGGIAIRGQSTYSDGVAVNSTGIAGGLMTIDGTTASTYASGVDFNTGGGSVSLTAAGGTTVTGASSATSLFSGAGGVRLNGFMTVSGPLAITGTATAGPSGTGVFASDATLTSDSSVSVAGTGSGPGVSIVGSSLLSSAGGITVLGKTSAGSGSAGVSLTTGSFGGSLLGASSFLTLGSSYGDLSILGSQVHNTGPGPMSLFAVPGTGASRITIDAASSVRQSGGADLTLTADAMTLAGTIGSGTGRTVIAPYSSSRGIWIGGVDDGSHLTLDTNALQGITASTLVIGGTSNDGGLTVLAPLTLANAPALSLIQFGDAAGTVGQASGATLMASSLHASGGGVTLTEPNFVQVLSGATAGGFRFNNADPSGLRIGTVDDASGIRATGGAILVTTPGLLQLTQPVTSDAPAGSNAVTLVADSLSTSGAGALQASNDRWAVFLRAPDAGLAGSPVSGNPAVWNRPFTGNVATDLPETGNRYVFAYQPQVTITAAPATKVYDGTDLTVAATVAGIPDAGLSGGVFNQDAVTALLTTGSRNVGSYPFAVQSVVQPAGYAPYLASLGPASGTITPAPLTVTAIDQNKPQGTTFTFAGSEIAATGLKGGEQLTSAALSSTGAAADVPFGNYPITVGGPLAGASGFAASNYLVTYQPGTLVVSSFNTPATQQVNNSMITFLQLFVQEALPPPKDKPKGDPDIVVTGTLCKPS